jgi:acyl-CoA reductase-like NAD-dependent aldehyde dehydrogenase
VRGGSSNRPAVARGSRAPPVKIGNDKYWSCSTIIAPYGGVKQSGIGRKAGLEGVLDYLQLQTISSFEP